MQSVLDFRVLGAAAALVSLAVMMKTILSGPSPEAIGTGLAGIAALLVSRIVPKRAKPTSGQEVATAPQASDTTAVDAAMLTAYRTGGLHPALASDIRRGS